MKKISGFTIASCVLAILTLIILLFTGLSYLRPPHMIHRLLTVRIIAIFIVSILAIIFGAKAIRKERENSNPAGKRLAMLGLWLGIIDLVIPIVTIIGFIVLMWIMFARSG